MSPSYSPMSYTTYRNIPYYFVVLRKLLLLNLCSTISLCQLSVINGKCNAKDRLIFSIYELGFYGPSH
jgi:hypothetical protein